MKLNKCKHATLEIPGDTSLDVRMVFIDKGPEVLISELSSNSVGFVVFT